MAGWPVWVHIVLSAGVAFVWLTFFTWLVNRWRKPRVEPTTSSVQFTQADSPHAVQQHQVAGRDALQVAGDLVLHQPARSSHRTISGTYLEDLMLVDKTPAELCHFYRDNTTLVADEIVERFKGKWLRYSGPISNISLIGVRGIMLASFEGTPHITMFFVDSTSKEYLSVKDKGDHVTAVGKISRIDSISLRLEDCEVLRSDE